MGTDEDQWPILTDSHERKVRSGWLFCIVIFVYQKMPMFSVFSLPSVQVFEVDDCRLYLSTMSYQKNPGQLILGFGFYFWLSAPAVVPDEELQQQERKERSV